MKKFFYYSAFVLFAAGLSFSFASCEKESVQEPPVLTITTEGEVAVEAAGGTAEFAYTLENPVDGATLSVKADADWITDFNTETEGKVTFTVAENTEETPRSAEVTLTYTYGEGETDKVTANITVNQATAEPEPVPEPVIKLASTEPVTVPADGATDLEMEYSIENPVDGAETELTANVDWITGECLETLIGNFAYYDVSRNTDQAERRATVTITYTYGEGKSVTAEFEVVQEAASAEVTTPVLNVTPEGDLTYPSEGSYSEQIMVTVTEPAEDGKITAASSADWVSEIYVSGSNKMAFVMFAVAENTSSEARNATLTVTYTYNGGETVDKVINISQSGKPEAQRYNLEADTFSGSYNGTWGDNGEPNFSFTLSSSTNDALSYDFDIYTESTYDINGMTIQPGTYTYSPDSFSAMKMSYYTTVRIDDNIIYLSSGTLEVKDNGDGTYTFVADLVDEQGNSHHVTYTGEAVCTQ